MSDKVLRTYLDLRRDEVKSAGFQITRYFVICTRHKVLLR